MGFHHKRHFDIHMTKHTRLKPHKCDICNKAFNVKLRLINHMRIHTSD